MLSTAKGIKFFLLHFNEKNNAKLLNQIFVFKGGVQILIYVAK
jgi:hypothetical protein